MATLAERRAQLEARREAAKLSDADQKEASEREEIEKLEAETKAAEKAKRDLDLARRLDAAREALGDLIPVRALAIEDHPHTFVVMAPSADAFREWEVAISKSLADDAPKDARAKAHRAIALASVYEWNGKTDLRDDKSSTAGDLSRLLIKNPAIASKISGEATSLAGLAADARKS